MAIYTQNRSAMMEESGPSDLKSPGIRSQAASSDPDFADNVNNPVPGWPLLAKVIAKNPSLEAFPTFTDLSIKSLLYYQAELIYLRKKLHRAEWTDYRHSEGENDKSHFAENLELFIVAQDEALKKGEEPPEQWEIIEKIRTTLEKYSKLVPSTPRK
jgi:hypothetical protein